MRPVPASHPPRKFCRLAAVTVAGMWLAVAHAHGTATADLSPDFATVANTANVPAQDWLPTDDLTLLLPPLDSGRQLPEPVAAPEPLPLLMVALGIMLYRVRFPHASRRDVAGVT